MAAPTVSSVYPTNGDVGIPIGVNPTVTFDILVDPLRAQQYFSIVGASEQFVSGPQLGLDEQLSEHRNPFYLTAPGMQGAVAKTVTVGNWNAGTEVTGDIYSEAASSGYNSIITFAPNEVLGESQTYTAMLLGDPTNTYGICKRTVYDPEPNVGNTGSGDPNSYGGYTGTSDDTLNIEITGAGDPGAAVYRFWYSSDPGSITSGRVAQRRFIKLVDGIQVQFKGSNYQVGDQWTINVYAPEWLAANYQWTFTTNDGTYTSVPSSATTPATSLPPSSVYPDSTSSSGFSVVSSEPESGDPRVSYKTNQIAIEFSADLDAATINDETVQMYVHPALGLLQGSDDATRFFFIPTVSGDTLTMVW